MSTTNQTGPSKGLNIALWVAQVLLALVFLGAGAMKLVTPTEELAAKMAWINGPLGGLILFIGVVEVLGGLGMILPAATRIQPKLTPLAAVGLVIVMIGAAATHAMLGEYAMMGGPVMFGAMAAFVAWGRFKKAPIAAR